MGKVDFTDLRSLLGKISEASDDPVRLHLVYTELTERLIDFKSGFSFSIGLLFKALLEDLLRNTIENTEVSPDRAQKVTQKLVSSIEALIDDNEQKWKDELTAFGDIYRDLARKREQGTIITANGIKFLIARYYNKLLVTPKIDFFPSLDATISDPETAGPVCRWYRDTIQGLMKERESPINGLCVVEKPYSTVGALTLVGYLAVHCKLPITIYRTPYWDHQHRISGKSPYPGARLCVVYDVSITGSGILEAADYFKQQYGAQVSHTVVLFDMEDVAKKKLSQVGIELHQFCKRSDIESEFEADKLLLRNLYALEKKADQFEAEDYLGAVENIARSFANTEAV